MLQLELRGPTRETRCPVLSAPCRTLSYWHANPFHVIATRSVPCKVPTCKMIATVCRHTGTAKVNAPAVLLGPST